MMSEKTNVNSILIFPSSSFSSFTRATFLLLLYNYLFLFPFFVAMIFFLEVGGVKPSYDYHFACWEACNFLVTPRR